MKETFSKNWVSLSEEGETYMNITRYMVQHQLTNEGNHRSVSRTSGPQSRF